MFKTQDTGLGGPQSARGLAITAAILFHASFRAGADNTELAVLDTAALFAAFIEAGIVKDDRPQSAQNWVARVAS